MCKILVEKLLFSDQTIRNSLAFNHLIFASQNVFM